MCNDNNVDRAEIERILTIANNNSLLTPVTGSGHNYPPIVNTACNIITLLVTNPLRSFSLEEINESELTRSQDELLIYLEVLTKLDTIMHINNRYQCKKYWE